MRIGTFLMKMLRCEYEDKKIRVAELSATQAVEHLNQQILAYTNSKYPFDPPVTQQCSIISWWCHLAQNPASAVLAHCAIRIYAMTPNSMADERTASVFTWLNSA
ncbi:hypothetical protein BDN71DRAFT_1017609 [Pleurotus eryngii]|uniref:Uncharacterized protein n=1 Tax=Pleurotus eryngii TaxID=5323 RepID=A0A9P5ZUB1_PLEER|nr:hypothetical protein BDN71DRAFT_1017609 [Pleurotus eryngii]